LHQLFDEACLAQTGGDFVDAKKNYLLLLGYFPRAAELHYNLGLVYYRLENYSAALDEFSTALCSQPEDGDTLFNLALCQKKSGDNEAAIATYQKLLNIAPDNTDCCYNLAGCYRDNFADDQAIAWYRKVLALDPEYLPALNNLAYLYFNGLGVERNLTEAFRYWEQAAEAGDANAQSSLGLMLSPRRRTRPACRSLSSSCTPTGTCP